MKTKLIRILVPPVLGILVVLGILFLIAFFRDGNFTLIKANGDVLFFKYFVPSALFIAWILQFTLVIPIWKKFKKNIKIFGLKIYQLITLTSLVGGILFGLAVFERNLGIKEFILVSITGFIAFAMYLITNMLSLRYILQNRKGAYNEV